VDVPSFALIDGSSYIASQLNDRLTYARGFATPEAARAWLLHLEFEFFQELTGGQFELRTTICINAATGEIQPF